MANVLIIDDDTSVCEMLKRLVGKLGHTATAANTLSEGLQTALGHDFDVVLLDVLLPDGNGLDYLPKIRKAPSAPEVIIMTGFGDADGAEMAIKNGAWDYIQKTDAPKKILLPLQRVTQYRDSVRKNRPTPVALKLDGIVGSSRPMKACFDLLAQAAISDANVLITGHTGTGKELFAHAVHRNSDRANRNFVVVDCAALPETLVESLLFGHAKGAYTDAKQPSQGLIAQAHGGTLFLDEVGELPFGIQRVFLRVLNDRSFRPLGGKQVIKSDFRLIAATNKNLDLHVSDGRFRDDLLFRLRAIHIELPGLRERPEDIAEIAMYHIAKLCERYEVGTKGFAPEFMEILTNFDWPGNARQLVQTLEAAITAAGPGQILFPKHLPKQLRIHAARSAVHVEMPPPVTKPRAPSMPQRSTPKPYAPPAVLPTFKQARKAALSIAERQYLEDLMLRSQGDVKEACRMSSLSRSRLYELLKLHSIN